MEAAENPGRTRSHERHAVNRLKQLTLKPLCMPRPRLLVRFFLAFIVALSLWFLIRAPLVKAHVYIANVALRISGNEDAQVILSDSAMCLRIAQPTVARDRPVYRDYRRGNKYGVGWTSIFYFTLCLCVPLRIAKKRWWYLCLVAIVFFSMENYLLVRLALSCVARTQAQIGGGALASSQSGRHQLSFEVYSYVLLAATCLLFLPLCFGKPGSR